MRGFCFRGPQRLPLPRPRGRIRSGHFLTSSALGRRNRPPSPRVAGRRKDLAAKAARWKFQPARQPRRACRQWRTRRRQEKEHHSTSPLPPRQRPHPRSRNLPHPTISGLMSRLRMRGVARVTRSPTARAASATAAISAGASPRVPASTGQQRSDFSAAVASSDVNGGSSRRTSGMASTYLPPSPSATMGRTWDRGARRS